jgi:hypothetical protein
MWGSKISAGGGKHRERTFRLLYRQSEHLNSGKKTFLIRILNFLMPAPLLLLLITLSPFPSRPLLI